MNEEPFVQKYLVRDPKGSMYGPADAALLRQWVQEGRIVRGMRIAEQETREWMEASQHPAVADLLQGTSPVPLPAPPVQAATIAPAAGAAPASLTTLPSSGIPLAGAPSVATTPTLPAAAPVPVNPQPAPHPMPAPASTAAPAVSKTNPAIAPSAATGAPIAAQPASPAASRTGVGMTGANPSQQSYAGNMGGGGGGSGVNALPSIPRSPLIVAAEARARAAAQAAQMAQAAQAIQAAQVPQAARAAQPQAVQPAPTFQPAPAFPRSPAAASPAQAFAEPSLPSLPLSDAAPGGHVYELKLPDEPLPRPALGRSTSNLFALLAFCGSLCAVLFGLGFCIPFIGPLMIPISIVLAVGAIVLASIALFQFRTIPRRQARRGFAIAGLTIGVFDIACFAAMGVFFMIMSIVRH